jgi:hypothetical protein
MKLWLHNLAASPGVKVDDHPSIPRQFPYRDQGYPFHHYQVAYFSQQENILLPRDPEHRGAKVHYLYALHASDQLEAQGLKGMPHDQRARAELNLGRIYSHLLPRGQRDPVRAEAHLRRAVEIGLQDAHLDWELAASLLELSLLRGRTPTIDLEAARDFLLDALRVMQHTSVRTEAMRELREAIELEMRRVEAEIERLREEADDDED